MRYYTNLHSVWEVLIVNTRIIIRAAILTDILIRLARIIIPNTIICL